MVVVEQLTNLGGTPFYWFRTVGMAKQKQSFVQSQNFFLLSFLRVKICTFALPNFVYYIISLQWLTDEYLVIVFGLFGLVDHHLHL